MIFLPLSVSSGIDLLLRDEYANWSTVGARLIMEYLDELSEDTGDPITFNHVAIRCEWSEYATIKEAADAYGITPDALEDRTTVLKHDASSVVVVWNY